MPKAFLKFDLPDEMEEFKTAMKASTFTCIIYDIKNHLRTLDKYGLPEPDKKLSAEEMVSKIREDIHKIINDNMDDHAFF